MPAQSYKQKITLLTRFPANTPRVFHVETTWNTRVVFVGLMLVV